MKNKQIFALCCAIILIIQMLTGCQLAITGTEPNVHSKEIGAFVTMEYLDLSGNEKVFAELGIRTYKDKETGKLIEYEEYIFKDIEGFAIYAPMMPATEERDEYAYSTIDEAFTDRHTGFGYGAENSIILRGTVNFLHGREITGWLHPVYQNADGSVYLMRGGGPGMSMSYGGEPGRESGGGSIFTDTTSSIIENGKPKSHKISVTVSFSPMYAPEKIVILQMDKDYNLILRAEYEPGTLPEELTPEEGTEYMIAEIQKHNVSGEDKTTLEVYGRGDEAIETFYARADGICVMQHTEINWM
ncbi:MAG: hypothetical protein LBJ21_02145 [Acidobacteriota bacterium]|jgi:hypothetical protein|nr:hypothetical protein [Acidobacteriota bacterium]